MNIDFCLNTDEAATLAQFFLNHTNPRYISHSEIICGRAIDEHNWAPNLGEIIETEIREAIEDENQAVIVARQIDDQILGVAILEVNKAPNLKHAWVHDLVVEQHKTRCGVGTAILKWTEQALAKQGVRRLFAESSFYSKRAHLFFESLGYSRCSRVLTKTL